MLLDSSVLVASAVLSHAHNAEASAALERGHRFTVAAHSLAELYNTLSKPSIYAWPPREAAMAVADTKRRCEIYALDALEFANAIAAFALAKGIGARLCDYLIGYHAVVRELGSIVTLDERDFRALFPDLNILTPSQYLEML